MTFSELKDYMDLPPELDQELKLILGFAKEQKMDIYDIDDIIEICRLLMDKDALFFSDLDVGIYCFDYKNIDLVLKKAIIAEYSHKRAKTFF